MSSAVDIQHLTIGRSELREVADDVALPSVAVVAMRQARRVGNTAV
jgi:hypothetical protein